MQPLRDDPTEQFLRCRKLFLAVLLQAAIDLINKEKYTDGRSRANAYRRRKAERAHRSSATLLSQEDVLSDLIDFAGLDHTKIKNLIARAIKTGDAVASVATLDWHDWDVAEAREERFTLNCARGCFSGTYVNGRRLRHSSRWRST